MDEERQRWSLKREEGEREGYEGRRDTTGTDNVGLFAASTGTVGRRVMTLIKRSGLGARCTSSKSEPRKPRASLVTAVTPRISEPPTRPRDSGAHLEHPLPFSINSGPRCHNTFAQPRPTTPSPFSHSKHPASTTPRHLSERGENDEGAARRAEMRGRRRCPPHRRRSGTPFSRVRPERAKPDRPQPQPATTAPFPGSVKLAPPPTSFPDPTPVTTPPNPPSPSQTVRSTSQTTTAKTATMRASTRTRSTRLQRPPSLRLVGVSRIRRKASMPGSPLPLPRPTKAPTPTTTSLKSLLPKRTRSG